MCHSLRGLPSLKNTTASMCHSSLWSYSNLLGSRNHPKLAPAAAQQPMCPPWVGSSAQYPELLRLGKICQDQTRRDALPSTNSIQNTWKPPHCDRLQMNMFLLHAQGKGNGSAEEAETELYKINLRAIIFSGISV